jgi:hypothetical protein
LTFVGIIVVVVSEMALEARLEKAVTLHLHGEMGKVSLYNCSRTQPWGSVRTEAKVHRHQGWEQQEYLARLAGNVEWEQQPVQEFVARLDLIYSSPVPEAAACQETGETYRLVGFGDSKDRQGAHG